MTIKTIQNQDQGQQVILYGKTAAGVYVELAVNVDGQEIVARPDDWSITHDAAVNTIATITKAAIAGSRHICTSLYAKLAITVALNTIVKVYLRDGEAGVGAILWSGNVINAQTSALEPVKADALNIAGTLGAAMTLEFSAASGASNSANVSMTGYTRAS